MAAPTPQATPTTPYEGLTFLQLQNMVWAWFGMSVTDAPSADVTLCKALLNEAIAKIIAIVPGEISFQKYYTFSSVKDQSSYPLPLAAVDIVPPLILDGAPLWPISRQAQNALLDPNYTLAETMYERRYSTWGKDNTAATGMPCDILYIEPAPTENGTIEIYGHGPDNALSADTDKLRIPTAYHSLPMYHAVQPFLSMRSRKNDLLVAQAMWKDGMGELVQRRRREIARSATFRLPNVVKDYQRGDYPRPYLP